MGQKIHFEDNIFFLNEIVRTLQRNMSLKPDPEYFLEKIIDDITFLDSTFTQLCSSLKGNPHLINRQQYLRYRSKTASLFIRLLESLQGNNAFDFSDYKRELEIILQNQCNNIQDVNRILFGTLQEQTEDQVSEEEFKHLFLENQ